MSFLSIIITLYSPSPFLGSVNAAAVVRRRSERVARVSDSDSAFQWAWTLSELLERKAIARTVRHPVHANHPRIHRHTCPKKPSTDTRFDSMQPCMTVTITKWGGRVSWVREQLVTLSLSAGRFRWSMRRRRNFRSNASNVTCQLARQELRLLG